MKKSAIKVCALYERAGRFRYVLDRWSVHVAYRTEEDGPRRFCLDSTFARWAKREVTGA